MISAPALYVAAVMIPQPAVQAASGTWTNTATGGLWNTTTNWSGGTIADLSGFTADFSTIDIAADNTVHLNSARTLTNLTFGDTSTASAAGWILDNNGTPANILTLAGTTPTITVQALGTGKNVTISAILAGTVGLTKAGAGMLVLNGSGVNTLTGGVNINGGTLALDFANLATPTDLITNTNALALSGGTLSVIGKATGTTSQTFAGLTLNSGASAISVNINGGTATNLVLGAITRTAGGVVNFTLPASGAISTSTGNTSGILGTWASVGSGASTQYATVSGGNITALTGTTAADANAFVLATDNYDFATTGTTVLSASRTANTIRFTGSTPNVIDLSTTAVSRNLSVNGITNAGTGLLTIQRTAGTGNLTAGSNELVINSAHTGGITISAPITGSGGLTKTGANLLTLSGANTYTGATTVNAGTLQAGAASVIPSGSAVTVNSGATLDFNGFNNTIASLTLNGGALSLGSGTLTTSALTLSPLSSGAYTISGGTLNGLTTINNLNANGAITTIGADVTRTGDLAIYGAGATCNLTFSGAVNLGGAGNLSLPATNNVGVNANNTNGTVTVSGTSSNTMGLSITSTKTGTNGMSSTVTVVLAKTAGAQAVSGNVSIGVGNGISRGIVQLGGSEQIADTATVTLGSSGYSGNSRFQLMNSDETIAGLISSSNSFPGGAGGTTAVENGSAVAGTSTLTISGSSTYTYGPNGGSTVSLRDGSTGKLALTKNGTGTQILNGLTLSYSGATAVNNGILSIRSSTLSGSAVTLAGGSLDLQAATISKAITGSTGSVTVTGGGTSTLSVGSNLSTYSGDTLISGTSTLTQSVANSLSASSLMNIGAGSTLNTGNFAGSVKALTGAGTVFLNGTSAILTLADGAAQNFGGVISGPGALTKSGTGTQTLSAANTFLGTTTVSGGTLNLANALALQNSTLATSAGVTFDSSVLSNAFTLGGLSGSGGLALQNNDGSPASIALTVGGNNATTTYSGALSAGGSLTKVGAGTLTLSVTNSYAGSTTINAGILAVNGSTNAASAVTVNAGGALGGAGTVNGTVTVNAGGGINLTTNSATGTLTLGSTLTLSGTATNQNALSFDLGSGAGGVDKIVATGAVTGSTPNSVVVNLRQLTGTITPGTYTLISSAATSNTSGMVLATTRAGGNVYTLTTTASGTGNVLQVGVATAAAGPAAGFWSGATDTSWGTLNNWKTTVSSNTTAAAVPGVGTAVTFVTTTPTATNLSTTLDRDYEISSLTFNTTATSTSIGGASMLTVDAASGITASNTTGTNTISAKVGLGQNQTWSVASGGTLAISGAITDFGSGFSLNKTVAGTLALSGANTYSGGTTLTLGTLTLGNAAALGTGTLTIVGGTLDSSVANLVNTNNNIQAWNGDFAFAGTNNLNLGTGAVTLSANRSVTVTANTLTVGGVISGANGGAFTLTKAGSGTLTLTGANTYSGNTNVNAGTLVVGNNNAVGSGGLTASVSGVTLAATTGSTITLNNLLTMSGGGTLNFGDANNTGSLIFSTASSLGGVGKTLSVADNTTVTFQITLAGNGSSPLTKTGNGTLILAGGTSYAADATISAGTLQIGGTYAGTTITMNGGTLKWDGTSTTDYSAKIRLVAATTATFDTNGNNVAFATALTGTTTTANLLKSGTGTLTLSGANTYTGTTTVSNGTLIAGTNSAVSTNGAFGNASSAIALGDANSISGNLNPTLLTGGAFTVGRAVTVGSSNAATNGTYTLGGNTANTSAFSSTLTLNQSLTVSQITGGTLNLTGNITSGSAGTQTVTVNNAGAVAQSTGVIGGGTGTIALVKSGAGTLTLSGTNTYTGNTLVTTGTLALGNNLALQNSALDTTGAGTVTVTGFTTPTLGGLTGSTDLATKITTGYGTVTTLTLNPLTGTQTYSGVIANGAAGMNLTKTGAGTQILSGANSYTGLTTVSVGELDLNTTGGQSISGNLTVNGGTAKLLQGNQINSAKNLVVSSTGTFDLQGFTQSVANLQLTGGTIAGSGGTLTSTNPFDVQSGSVSAILGGGVALNKTTTGNVTLSGANTYTGLTTVNGGLLSIGSSGSLNSGNALTLGTGGAATFANAGQSLGAVNNANTAANALYFSAGSGTVTLASLSGGGNTTFAGNGTVTAGISAGTVTAGGLLTADISGGTTSAGSLIAGSVSGGTNTVSGAAGITTLSNGTTTVGGVATIGTVSGGTANLNGATSSVATLSGGTVNLGSTALSIDNGNTSGAITGGGSLIKSTAGILTLNGTNTYTGGTTINSGTLALGHATDTLSSTGTVAISGGVLDLANHSDSVGAVTTTGGSIASSGGNGILNGLGLTKTGSGTTTVNSGVTYSGGSTLISGGVLAVNGTIANTGTTTVGSTGTLSGSGRVSNAVTVQSGGSTRPSLIGSVSGSTLTLDLTYNSGSTASSGIFSGTTTTNSTAGYDQVVVTTTDLQLGAGTAASQILDGANGSAASGVTLNLSMTSAVFASLKTNASSNYQGQGSNSLLNNYFVFSLDSGLSTAGRFETLSLDINGSLFSSTIQYGGTGFGRFGQTGLPNWLGDVTVHGQEFAISYTGNFASNSTIGGNDIVLTAIPEPGSMASLLGGLGVLVALQRRRRRF